MGGAQGGTVTSIISTTALTKEGSGTWTLNGVNTYSGATTVSAGTTYTGATTINAGTLKIGAAGGVITNASAVVVGASGTLDVYYSETVGSISGSGTIYTQSPSSNIVLTMGGDNSSTTFSGNLSMGQTALGYVKTGTGTLAKLGSGLGSGALTLGGTNTYTGGTTISAGTLTVQVLALLAR